MIPETPSGYLPLGVARPMKGQLPPAIVFDPLTFVH